MQETLKFFIVQYLIEHGTTGGEVLRKGIQDKYYLPGSTFSRALFIQLMSELVVDKRVRDDSVDGRRRYTALFDPNERT